MIPLVNYLVAKELPLPPISAHLYEYIFGGNGVFIRGRRFGFEIMWQISTTEIRGLPNLSPFLRWELGAVPQNLLKVMLAEAGNSETEILWYLTAKPWTLVKPPQEADSCRVQPTYTSLLNSAYEDAVIEIHSHGDGPAYFSAVDNADEQGFRVYAVLGQVRSSRPTIVVRIGLAGYFCPIPAYMIFEIPPGLEDGYTKT
ncbi:MAG: Mov34/MPN/PAD-1 family protein [Tolypothrix sp. Co-bin9]|nr:Mov34/MPN/PAD-1 family protein [Tolypothrix sp. Co-bin9]